MQSPHHSKQRGSLCPCLSQICLAPSFGVCAVLGQGGIRIFLAGRVEGICGWAEVCQRARSHWARPLSACPSACHRPLLLPLWGAVCCLRGPYEFRLPLSGRTLAQCRAQASWAHQLPRHCQWSEHQEAPSSDTRTQLWLQVQGVADVCQRGMTFCRHGQGFNHDLKVQSSEFYYLPVQPATAFVHSTLKVLLGFRGLLFRWPKSPLAHSDAFHFLLVQAQEHIRVHLGFWQSQACLLWQRLDLFGVSHSLKLSPHP